MEVSQIFDDQTRVQQPGPIHILEENSVRIMLEQLAKTGYYTIRRGKVIDSGVQELKWNTKHLMEVYAGKVDLIVILKQIT